MSVNHKRWCQRCRSNTHDTSFCRKSQPQQPSTSVSDARQGETTQKYGSKQKWCEICRNKSHFTRDCRKVSRLRNVKDTCISSQCEDSEHFTFCVDQKAEAANHHVNATKLLVDSGASVHIVNDKSKFTKFKENFQSTKHVIELADGTRNRGLALGQGDAEIGVLDSKGNMCSITLENALYIPSFSQNIFSVTAATEKGATVIFSENSGKLYPKSKSTCLNIHKEGRLYFLNSVQHANNQKISKRPLKLWHEALGHCNTQDILKLEEKVEGMIITHKTENFKCEVCPQAKMTDSRSRIPDDSASAPFDLVHIDLSGPIDPESIDGHKYALVCVDSFSKLTCVYFLKHKNDACDAFKQYIADIVPYGSIKSVRSDQGGEFISKEFTSMLVRNKICHERSAPYSQHQNGKAERAWRTLFEMARCLLVQSGLPKNLWTYAVLTAAYIRNRCFNKKLDSTPFQQVTGKKPNIANLQPFGSKCFCLVQNPRKLDNRSVKGTFIGYDRRSPAYLIYFPETQEVRKIRCVTFHNEYNVSEKSDSVEIPFEDHLHDENSPGNETQNKTNPAVTAEEIETIQQQTQNSQGADEGLGKRIRTRPKYLDDYIVDDNENNCDENDLVNSTFLHYCYNTVHYLPTCYNNAILCDDASKWQKAMDDEMNALVENDTFECKTLPPGRKAVGGRWVFNVKSNPNGEEIFKARYVAKGFSQIPGIDFQETFSPTARITSVRTLIQLAVQNNQIVHQMDVKTAYLNAPIDCELFVEQPEGYVKTNEKGEKYVWKLKKSLYGLKQSGRNWNHLLHKHLIDDGYLKATMDQKLIFRKSVDSLNLTSFCDSDWGNSGDRKSITGYCFTLSNDGPLISWKSKRQQSVALSSCEAEYMAMSSATQEGKFLLALVNDMYLDLNDFTLNCDNQGAIALSKNPIQHQRSKHIDIRYHFIRDEISKGLMKVQYVPSEENLADVFTKPVSRVKMQKFKALLMGN
ncbi:hypothetical protein EGW08_001710 [Elysia chlorotica]|uniref:Integrase catalytic domain-containing protein n=1 Tax=Elysia chlorotica TaxID=188477 RepID=A0A3S1AFJ4_ELYCH|nr:hypothetical protein EGW08_001710 [Elysia chlorotica]